MCFSKFEKSEKVAVTQIGPLLRATGLNPTEKYLKELTEWFSTNGSVIFNESKTIFRYIIILNNNMGPFYFNSHWKSWLRRFSNNHEVHLDRIGPISSSESIENGLRNARSTQQWLFPSSGTQENSLDFWRSIRREWLEGNHKVSCHSTRWYH